ncbi:polyphosphate polymerase domain-containing protein [Glycomyces paridis]|uniref:Polyphosphate polymerase domain-containing protein n=1 Tax=Glycomyces paridis TaxID=2126555 RepID=A0A4S8PAE0_9ACTN|nr:polyphosphate polymerase domain-containing protein [Glycomyces paridis]THV27243.1 polyphosphate polymerase domain-containing protein [Glycomyces paridis]
MSGPDAPPAEPGDLRRTASALHSFNRFEIKYLLSYEDVPRLREELAARMEADPYTRRGGYPVASLYYDSPSLRYYWEKIEGLRFRRKLRVRAYGERGDLTDDSPVYLEIKQRVNRVTQKRRVRVPYRLARRLCDDAVLIDHAPEQRAFLEEVLGLVEGHGLRPTAITAYQREAYLGSDADLGLRVTLDHRVRGRDRDFHLGAEVENRLIIPPHKAVVEVKANERVPYWVTDTAARLGMSVVRISKYCQSIEAHGLAPRSVFHVPTEDDHSVRSRAEATASL